MFASTPDLLRLLVVPVLGWAAWRDVKTRRVPNRTWYPLVALALVLLVWEGATAVLDGNRLFLVQVAISVGFVVPLVTAFWYMGSFGGADAKAFYVIALLFPAYPAFYLSNPSVALPLEPTPIGIFSLTILSNTVLVAVAYPLAVAVRNFGRGHLAWPMLVGKPVRWDDVTDEYGVLLETPDGYTRRGLDLDALRMYLQWRGDSLPDLRADPETARDPASLPADPNRPGDGGLATDGGTATDQAVAEPATARTEAPATAADDPWGAERFLDDIDHSAYGTTPEQLRDGLDVLVASETVWVSPGIPFIVPTFVGLLVSLLYGDVMMTLVGALGLA